MNGNEQRNLEEMDKTELIDLLEHIKIAAGNYLQMSRLPLPDSVHKDGLAGGMKEIIELANGINAERIKRKPLWEKCT